MTGQIDEAFRKFDLRVAMGKDMRIDLLHRMRPLEKMLKVVTDILPQASSISADDQARWCRDVPRICATEVLLENGDAVPDDDESWAEWDQRTPITDPARSETAQRALWHARRLGGIGGSETGPLVAAASGERDWFASPTGIAAEKLMKRLPVPPDHHMLRGKRAESFVREQAAREHGWRHCPDLLAAVTGGRVAAAPWITSSPDDIVRWTGGAGAARRHMIIDYKSPSTDPMADLRRNGIPLRYAAQLHHYLQVARDNIDTPIEQMMLCAFDADRWETLLLDCPEDPALSGTIRRACAEFWAQVMDGEIPRPPVADPAPVGDRVKEWALRAFALMATEKEAASSRKLVLEEIGRLQAQAAGGSSPVGPAVMSSRTTWDAERLGQLLQASPDLELESFLKPGGSLDEAAMRAALAQEGKRARALADSIAAGSLDAAGAAALARNIEALAVQPATKVALDSPRAAKALQEAGEDVDGCRKTSWQVGASRVSDPAISAALEEVELTARAGVDAVSEEIEEVLDVQRGAALRAATADTAPRTAPQEEAPMIPAMPM